MNTNIWKSLKLPLLVLLIILSLYFFWQMFDLPSDDQLKEVARSYFTKYGLATVFISAILEGIVLVGWYYPGSLAIFLGVIFAGKDVGQVMIVVTLVILGLFISYLINFWLGKYGWYRLLLAFGLKEPLARAQQRLTKYGAASIALTYWQPNLAALTATAAGVLNFSFRKFFVYSLVATIIWNAGWGILVYFMGEVALSLIGLRFALVAVGVWIFARLWLSRKTAIKMP